MPLKWETYRQFNKQLIIKEKTQTTRFEEEEDCYLDVKTGLKWSQENYGPLKWYELMNNQVGDWKVPTIDELRSIVNKCSWPSNEPTTDLPEMLYKQYWSETSDMLDPFYARIIDFSDSNEYGCHKTMEIYARLIKR